MSFSMKRAGVMGWPVQHSLSPRLHMHWLKQFDIVGTYTRMAVEPEGLEAALRHLPQENYCGVNLTVPHKEVALTFLDEIEPLARKVGAVNTVVVRADKSLYGRNTDVYGFTQNLLTAGFKPGMSATLLGAGGAARAGLAALLAMGMQDIRIMNRTRDKAEKLAEEFGMFVRAFAWGDEAAFENSGLLANATTLGMKGQPPLELDFELLPASAWVTDMVYTPLETELLRRAAMRGLRTVDGLGMLLHQARPAFEAFFGVDPEVTPELRACVLEGMA